MHSPKFPADFDAGIYFLVEESGRKALDQVGATPEQRAKLNVAELIDALDTEGFCRVADIDTNIPEGSEECVIPVLDKALRGGLRASA